MKARKLALAYIAGAASCLALVVAVSAAIDAVKGAHADAPNVEKPCNELYIYSAGLPRASLADIKRCLFTP